jgi:DNA (cytosine-5)-methyltransferase 1
MNKLKVLDLFSGIGGFSLGLERTGGFSTVAFCEINEFCQRVLAKHWPGVPCYDDIRRLDADTLARDGIGIDVICGGFPCQDLSFAGKRAGLEGARSGLWGEYARLIRELRPAYVIVENVPGLLSLGLGDVLGDLAASGYDAVWDCIPAAAVGADHIRDRVWIIAHANGNRLQERKHVAGASDEADERLGPWGSDHGSASQKTIADTNGGKRSLGRPAGRAWRFEQPVSRHTDWQTTHQPVLDRGADGVPDRLDRLKALGNAVVPQVVELLGRAILEARNA